MKSIVILTVTVLFFISNAFGQRPDIELTFTAADSSAYVQLNSIKIMNRTQGGDTVLYWPDTVLSLSFVGLPDISNENNQFKVFQNYPNPVADQTTVSVYVPEKDIVSIMVTDILGRVIVKSERELDKGKHTFRFVPGKGNLCFFTATWQGLRSSIKMLQNSPVSYNTGMLEYIGCASSSPPQKAGKDIQSFPFGSGDTLLYIGYSDSQQSGMLDNPEESEDYTFQFATNIPCPGTPTVTYEGQVYNTIQIFSQCWLKENLNVGTIILGSQEMMDNDIIEKYCYNNAPANCLYYGGLYQWNEMMQYTTQQGVQGICPPGWHLPTNEEWKVLEGSVDYSYGIGDPEWDGIGERGFTAGMNLKNTIGWANNGDGTNLFGFSGMPGGFRYPDGTFHDVFYHGYWWSSTDYSTEHAWERWLAFSSWGVRRVTGIYKVGGSGVRCIKDY